MNAPVHPIHTHPDLNRSIVPSQTRCFTHSSPQRASRLTANPPERQATFPALATTGIFGLHLGFSSLTSRHIPSRAAALTAQLDQFAVIDGKTVITGSFNWSPSAAHQNDEVLLVIRSPQVAAHFTREMDRLWRTADLGITERLRRKLERNRQRCGRGIQRS